MKRTFRGLCLLFLITTTIPAYSVSFGGFFSSLRNKTTLALASVATLCAGMLWYARAKARSINILGGYQPATTVAHQEQPYQIDPAIIFPQQNTRYVPSAENIRADAIISAMQKNTPGSEYAAIQHDAPEQNATSTYLLHPTAYSANAVFRHTVENSRRNINRSQPTRRVATISPDETNDTKTTQAYINSINRALEPLRHAHIAPAVTPKDSTSSDSNNHQFQHPAIAGAANDPAPLQPTNTLSPTFEQETQQLLRTIIGAHTRSFDVRNIFDEEIKHREQWLRVLEDIEHYINRHGSSDLQETYRKCAEINRLMINTINDTYAHIFQSPERTSVALSTAQQDINNLAISKEHANTLLQSLEEKPSYFWSLFSAPDEKTKQCKHILHTLLMALEITLEKTMLDFEEKMNHDSDSDSTASVRDLRMQHSFANTIFAGTSEGLRKASPFPYSQVDCGVRTSWTPLERVDRTAEDKMVFTPRACPDKKNKILLLAVHGTWSNPNEFGLHSEFAASQELYNFATLLAQQYNKPVELWFPRWSGSLSFTEREQASDAIMRHLSTQENIHEIWALGHSHGCNVITHVASRYPIHHAIYIASPTADIPDSSRININNLYSFYSGADITQIAGSFVSNMSLNRKPLAPTDSLRVHNIRIQRDGCDLDHINILDPVIRNLPWILATIDTYYPESCDVDTNIESADESGALKNLPTVALRRKDTAHQSFEFSKAQNKLFKAKYGRNLNVKRQYLTHAASSEIVSILAGAVRQPQDDNADIGYRELTPTTQLRDMVAQVEYLKNRVNPINARGYALMSPADIEPTMELIRNSHETLSQTLIDNDIVDEMRRFLQETHEYYPVLEKELDCIARLMRIKAQTTRSESHDEDTAYVKSMLDCYQALLNRARPDVTNYLQTIDGKMQIIQNFVLHDARPFMNIEAIEQFFNFRRTDAYADIQTAINTTLETRMLLENQLSQNDIRIIETDQDLDGNERATAIQTRDRQHHTAQAQLNRVGETLLRIFANNITKEDFLTYMENPEAARTLWIADPIVKHLIEQRIKLLRECLLKLQSHR